MRDLTPYRRKLVEQIASEKNWIQKILQHGNIKLSSVVSNMSGAVATKIIEEHLKANELELDKT